MAGDWIKVRQELFTHPRFLALAHDLIYNDDRPGLLIYVCGENALGVNTIPPSDIPLCERALRCVTEEALRAVTMSSLLKVWCAVNAHCKIEGTDAVMFPFSIFELDAIAGFDGFGETMIDVGWVVNGKRNSLRFPNFLEFNEPACLRKNPLSNAERQRLYRERKNSVTKSNGCNDREELEKSLSSSSSPLALSGALKKLLASEGLAVASLRDTGRLLRLSSRLAEVAPEFSTDEGCAHVVGAAERVLQKLASDKPSSKLRPMGLFSWIVSGRRWSELKNPEMDRAYERIRQHTRGQSKPGAIAEEVAGKLRARETIPAQSGG